jgi:hypothetical protein
MVLACHGILCHIFDEISSVREAKGLENADGAWGGNMNQSCELSAVQFAVWLGGIVRSLFPWPAIVLFVFLFSPLRRALSNIVESLADSISALRSLKMVGVELTLDPEAARVMRAKSTALVFGDYERAADEAARQVGIWEKFTRIIEGIVKPHAKHGFRSTIHIQDTLEPESLYQLINYIHVDEQSGPPTTRGRRNSIRFGIIGRAWRLGRSDYDPHVTTDINKLVEVWGMTHDEAARAGRGRQSFAVILLRDASGGFPGLIFIDSQEKDLLGTMSISDLEQLVNDAAGSADGLTNSLARVRNTLAQNVRAPSQ